MTAVDEAPWVVCDAEGVVALEWLAIEALRSLTAGQLRGLVWVGLLDDGWRRLVLELDARGESL